jgi:DNA-binding transcriptional regulator YiaG
MRFSGKVYKDGKFWLAEIPILDAMTQGHTKKEAFEMALDMVKSMMNKEEVVIDIFKGKDGEFEVGSSDSNSLVSLLLQRKRQISGLSLSQVAKRLGLSSRNSYARYERGQSAPTIGKLGELLRAVDPNSDIVINDSIALTRR